MVKLFSGNLYTFPFGTRGLRLRVIRFVLYAVLNDRWVTRRRAFNMDVLLVGLSILNLVCFLASLLYLMKNYIPEWSHDLFEWGKTKHKPKQSSWTQDLLVPNRWACQTIG